MTFDFRLETAHKHIEHIRSPMTTDNFKTYQRAEVTLPEKIRE